MSLSNASSFSSSSRSRSAVGSRALGSSAKYWSRQFRDINGKHDASPGSPRSRSQSPEKNSLLGSLKNENKGRYRRKNSNTSNGLHSGLLYARRNITLVQKLFAGMVGVWLVIAVVLFLGGGKPSVEFDPLRNKIHNTKQLVAANDPKIHFVGRWSRNKAQGAVAGVVVSTPFPGMYVDVKFTGTSLGIHLGNVDDPATMSVSIDRSVTYDVLPYGREVVAVASDLEDAMHDARIVFSGAQRIDVEGFYVDKEREVLPSGLEKRQLIEILQDHYNSSLPDVFSWSYQLANQFAVDRVLIPGHGQCITDCPHDSIGLDKFFFLGSLGASRSSSQYWHFDEYRPKLVILDIGQATKRLIDHKLMYKTLLPQDASKTYTETYMNLIWHIRKKAYRRVPIFVLRPFDGSLEQESLQVVTNVRQQGDKNVHWIDTSNWDKESFLITGRLETEPERQARYAAFLSIHACPFLKNDGGCDFLRPFEGKDAKPDET
ncbi:hypothetical protein V1514DRAFT_352314 [Lipomyces japonicus]|uniref:uncharacterized protein n=1 Tax=Lipomyces japonicus TaxID=56871 RepID=UPI0034CD2925